MQKIILALAGEMGCGKGTVTKYLVEKYNAEVYRFSNPLRDILTRMHKQTSRTNMQRLSTALRWGFWEDILSEIVVADIGTSASEMILIDGVRRQSDLKYLSHLMGFRLIYIDAYINTRYSRITFRGENAADTTKTIEEFLQESEAEPEARIRELKDISDYVLENNGAVDDFHEKIDEVLREIKQG